MNQDKETTEEYNALNYIATVLENSYIPHTPTPKQREFLYKGKPEALYGGSAGGGKSDLLLMGALQYVTEPDYAALLLRRTYPQLSLPGGLLPRSKEWLKPTDAHWSGDLKEWRFPNGAVVAFGHIQHDDDIYNYQSSEFHYVGFDELTQFTEEQYTYMHSRTRRAEGSNIPIRVWSASNPGNRGHKWVKGRFIDTPEDRWYLPARLQDNPYLDQREYIRSLHNLSSIHRQQLLDGDWDAVIIGGKILPEWIKTYHSTPMFERVCVGVDPSIGKNQDSNYTGMVAVGKQGDRLYVFAEHFGRWESREREEQLDRFCERTKPDVVCIEDTTMSGDWVSRQKERLRGRYVVRGMPTRGLSKAARLEAIIPSIEGEMILFAPGLSELRGEMVSFPFGMDDLVDALVYGVLGLREAERGNSERFLSTWRS